MHIIEFCGRGTIMASNTTEARMCEKNVWSYGPWSGSIWPENQTEPYGVVWDKIIFVE